MLTTRILDIIHEYGIDSIFVEEDHIHCRPGIHVTLRKGNFKRCQLFSREDMISYKDFDSFFIHWLEDACQNLILM